jgi:WXG100 family type VII secretion target
MPDKTRVEYETLASVAAQFEREAQRIKQTTQGLARKVDTLCGPSWVGRGADVFQREMEGSVLPSLSRLEQALTESSRFLKAINKLFQEAETEAAGYLKISGEGGEGGSDGGDSNGAQSAATLSNASSANFGPPPGPEVSQDVKDRWAKLSTAEKKRALQNMADDIAKQNGMKSIPVSVEPIPDEGGTRTHGEWDGKKIRVNEVDLNNPSVAMNTVAHEAQHAVQQNAAEKVDQVDPATGQKAQLPPGITEEQARSWKDNFANYKPAPTEFVIGPGNPYKARWDRYLNQPVEKDAFARGDQFAKGMTKERLDGYAKPTTTSAPATPTAAAKKTP